MTETEFTKESNQVFVRIEQALDTQAADIDYLLSNDVLEIEFEDGGKIIVNRHNANQELWIAAKSGGYHFCWQAGQWIAHRDGSELFQTLTQVIQAACGQHIQFS